MDLKTLTYLFSRTTSVNYQTEFLATHDPIVSAANRESQVHRAVGCNDGEFPGKGGSRFAGWFRAYPGAPAVRRCIAHYLMDGFSLCSVDSLTTGAPDCTLRRFSGATENRRSLYQGDTVASLHNEQDAATP